MDVHKKICVYKSNLQLCPQRWQGEMGMAEEGQIVCLAGTICPLLASGCVKYSNAVSFSLGVLLWILETPDSIP